jgi:hypothetical protein
MAFKVLHRFLVLLRRKLRLKRAEISSFPSVRLFLAGIQPILAGFKFPNHGDFSVARGTPMHALPSRVSTLKVFKFTLAGPVVTVAVHTSKQELCHGPSPSAVCLSRTRASIS